MAGVLEGRCAAVAGSSRGIGRAVARALASEGARVIVNGRGDAEVAEVVDAIRSEGGDACGIVGSVTDFDVAEDLIGLCLSEFGAIDILVNCVGVAEPPGSSILDLDADAWRRLIDAHLTSVFNTCRHATPHMKTRGRGAIVNTSSHAFLGAYGGTGYPAGKGGTNSLTFALAAELREHGIRVNAVCPGARTRLSTGDEYTGHIESLHARGLLGRPARDAALAPPDPEHVGPLYTFLASDLARGISGRIFSAVGGYVGLFDASAEALVAFKDHRSQPPWAVEELAAKILTSPALSEG